MKKFLNLFLGIIICIFICSPAFAEKFYIEEYDVDITVTENKTAQVTENINAYFTQPAHGIFRTIPLANNKISNVEVSERYSESYDLQSKNLTLKIGNPNNYVTGRHSYRITYDFQILDDKNEFYFNIIGTQWQVPINKAYFSVVMPKPFNYKEAGVSIGNYGTTGFSSGALITMNDNKITGHTTRILNPNEGITVRIPVDENYFITGNKNLDWDRNFKILAVVMLIVTALSYTTWFNHGKDKEVIEVVNFYPPKGYNSAETELLYNGNATDKGLTSLIIYLANKGYLKITEDDIFGFTLEKIKPYDGNNKFEEAFMTALFEKSDKADNLTLSGNSAFASRCSTILAKMNEARNNIFEPESIGCKLTLTMLFFAIVNVLSLFFGLFGGNIAKILSMGIVMLFPLIAIILFVAVMMNAKDGYTRLFITLWAAGFGGIPFFGFILPNVSWSNLNLPFITMALTCSIISVICMVQLPKRNDFGTKILGEIEGFKHFLEVAEKWRIETLVRDNPEYVYDVLPYAYVLDVSDKWIKKLEEFMTFKPKWYNGSHFTINKFNTFTSAMTPRTTSTSSHGGGGFSGGGHGGGGGGSW